MERGPDWRENGEAVEYWLLAALVGGSFLAGAWGFVRWLLG